MNCHQCGAPMKVQENQIVFHCDYCGSYDFSDPNRDGVALLEESSPYECPACGEKLVTAAVNRVRVFSCPNCRGNLIPQSKMHPILRQSKPPASLPDEESIPPDLSEFIRTIPCPSCRNLMEVYPYGGAGNILIQGCAACALIWLDFGELSKILLAYARQQDQSREDPSPGRQS